ncbi:MAG: MerR family transcriptional regulator [Leucobacter sp.]
MRISELVEHSGVSVATVKFYLREGMLPRGKPVSATRAEYSEEHLSRLKLIAALAEVRGLSLARVRDILALVDGPMEDPVEVMGHAVGALPPYPENEEDDEHTQARAAIDALGWTYEPRFAAVAQLESAIRAVRDAGLPWGDAEVRRYGAAMLGVATEEVAPIFEMDPVEALSYAVLGTALYEPVLLALRRLAHHHRLTTSSH